MSNILSTLKTSAVTRLIIAVAVQVLIIAGIHFGDGIQIKDSVPTSLTGSRAVEVELALVPTAPYTIQTGGILDLHFDQTSFQGFQISYDEPMPVPGDVVYIPFSKTNAIWRSDFGQISTSPHSYSCQIDDVGYRTEVTRVCIQATVEEVISPDLPESLAEQESSEASRRSQTTIKVSYGDGARMNIPTGKEKSLPLGYQGDPRVRLEVDVNGIARVEGLVINGKRWP